MSSSIISQAEWSAAVQERLADAALWNIINDVKQINGGVYHQPYSTPGTFGSHTRYSAYAQSDVTIADEYATCNQSAILSQPIDRADLVQSQYAKLIKLAQEQGVSAGEKLDNLMLAAHAGWTDFGVGDLTTIGSADTTQITIDINNIDDILDTLDATIDTAKGNKLANRNGKFIIWRPKDFKLVKQLARSQGFASADDIIINGMNFGVKYMGWEHYVSNQHTANHVFAGVKNLHFLGTAPGAFPMTYQHEEPSVLETDGDPASGNLSAIAMVTRLDYVYKTWANYKPVLFDVNCA
jgi:hypothetical protein